ncbi:glycosyltransferase [Paenibacillus piri]|uniref:Glycosyltransferase n=1 Tax=Paenibacillus piri TaxID=2547395 RepID=A0A4R5KWX4_9BACL|nr:glycosyltransferase [Paenibacillus piri]TDG00317.1 glycosyltransferase [Paenibacillus piri]
MNHRESYKILGFATQGSNGDDEQRLRSLLADTPVYFYPFERSRKWMNGWRILRYMYRERPHLVVMEGTGIAGGLALIVGSTLTRVPYVVSSGDAIGPYIANRFPLLGPLFHWYERLLYKRSTGFIGWTPYLAGRALTYGAKFAMTAAGWAPVAYSSEQLQQARSEIRSEYGIPERQLVIGIVGSLNWNRRLGYCYGYELVKAAGLLERRDVTVLIVGDGSGKARLEQLAGASGGPGRVIFTGRVPREKVPAYLAAMDLASLPQSVDQVGSFRYTTKVSEYLCAGLPIVTGRIPMSYDFNHEGMYRIHGDKPWEPKYIRSLAGFLECVTSEEVKERGSRVPRQLPLFDKESQVSSVRAFIHDILTDHADPESQVQKWHAE